MGKRERGAEPLLSTSDSAWVWKMGGLTLNGKPNICCETIVSQALTTWPGETISPVTLTQQAGLESTSSGLCSLLKAMSTHTRASVTEKDRPNM